MMARTKHARSVEDVLVDSGEVQGLKNDYTACRPFRCCGMTLAPTTLDLGLVRGVFR